MESDQKLFVIKRTTAVLVQSLRNSSVQFEESGADYLQTKPFKLFSPIGHSFAFVCS